MLRELIIFRGGLIVSFIISLKTHVGKESATQLGFDKVQLVQLVRSEISLISQRALNHSNLCSDMVISAI